MNALPSARIEATLRAIVHLLVSEDYRALERLSRGVRLNAHEIETAVRDYGRTLVAPPPDAFNAVDVVPIRSTSPAEYSVRFRLFTKEEGQSDLELQATLIDSLSDGLMKVELDNVIVA